MSQWELKKSSVKHRFILSVLSFLPFTTYSFFLLYIHIAGMYSSFQWHKWNQLEFPFFSEKCHTSIKTCSKKPTDWVHQQLLWQHRHFCISLSHSFLSTARYLPFTKPSSTGGTVKHLILPLCYIYKIKINNRHHLKRQTSFSSG